jgi:F0F1-type ATP synthase assembly protein I
VRGFIVQDKDKNNADSKNSFVAVMRTIAPLMHFGWTLAVAVGGLGYIGHLLDMKWSTDPWMTLLGVLLGIFTSFFTFFKIISKINQKER